MDLTNIAFGIIQLILIGYILYDEVTKKSPAVFMWATLFLMFAFPHIVAVFVPDEEYSTEVITDASVFVTMFCILYIAFRRKKRLDFVKLESDRLTLEQTVVKDSFFEIFCAALLIISVAVYLSDFILSQGGLLNTSWANARNVSESYVNLSGLAIRLILTFSGMSLYFFLTKRKCTALFIIALLALMVVITRNRVQIIPVLVMPIVVVLLKIKVIKPRHIILAGLMAVAVIYVVYGIRAFRWLGTLRHAMDVFSFEYLNSTIWGFLKDQDGELGLRRIFYFFIDNNNDFEGFNKGSTYLRMLLVFLPSRLTFGLKPESFDLTMGQAIGMVEGGSTHPTLFGDCFGNLGWWGILLGIFWAVFCNIVDYIIERQPDDFFKIMIFFLASYSYVVMGRGSVYNGFQALAWGVVLLIILRIIFFSLSGKKLKIAFYV